MKKMTMESLYNQYTPTQETLREKRVVVPRGRKKRKRTQRVAVVKEKELSDGWFDRAIKAKEDKLRRKCG